MIPSQIRCHRIKALLVKYLRLHTAKWFGMKYRAADNINQDDNTGATSFFAKCHTDARRSDSLSSRHTQECSLTLHNMRLYTHMLWSVLAQSSRCSETHTGPCRCPGSPQVPSSSAWPAALPQHPPVLPLTGAQVLSLQHCPRDQQADQEPLAPKDCTTTAVEVAKQAMVTVQDKEMIRTQSNREWDHKDFILLFRMACNAKCMN